MHTKFLGGTDLSVSKLCLGTMTWGEQTNAQDAHRQIETALDQGINIIDTAEMYPTNPMRAQTQGDTERIIGDWIASSGKRDRLVIATKITGEGNQNVRDGAPISAKTISMALDASLRSLKTDYIDIYQLHWPNRGSYMFRKNWQYDPSGQDTQAFHEHVDEVLDAIDRHVKAGKIRYFGLSNESAWGTANWLAAARTNQRPRVITVQNEYSLLCRLFDLDMAELCHHEQVDLLAFSPLAAGLLTGKYQSGQVPSGSRMQASADLGGRLSNRVGPAVTAYLDIAKKYGIDPIHMALSWAQSRPFMGSVIFGATHQVQLEHILKGADIKLSDEILNDIQLAHKAHPMPY